MAGTKMRNAGTAEFHRQSTIQRFTADLIIRSFGKFEEKPLAVARERFIFVQIHGL